MPLDHTLFTKIFLVMLALLFFAGLGSFFAGITILLRNTFSRDVRTLATQTNRLAQKGILDGVTGLVGTASALMDATNQLVRTSTGIGAFLMLVGLLLMFVPAGYIMWKFPAL